MMVYKARRFQPREPRDQIIIRPEGTVEFNPTYSLPPSFQDGMFLLFSVPRIEIRGYMKPRRIRSDKIIVFLIICVYLCHLWGNNFYLLKWEIKHILVMSFTTATHLWDLK